LETSPKGKRAEEGKTILRGATGVFLEKEGGSQEVKVSTTVSAVRLLSKSFDDHEVSPQSKKCKGEGSKRELPVRREIGGAIPKNFR